MTETELTTAAGIPALVVSPDGAPRAPAIIFLHGLGGDRTTHLPEARLLAAAGLVAILPDAPHHRGRPGDLLVEMSAAPVGPATHAIFLRLIDEAARELPGLVDELLGRGHPRVAVGGASLGGFTALAAGADEPRFAAVVSMIASPESWPFTESPPANVAALVAREPARRPDAYPPRPLALFTAGRDEIVDPEPTRRFVAALRPRYAATPDHLLHREYPESAHMMRPEDWRDVWDATIPFLRRALLP